MAFLGNELVQRLGWLTEQEVLNAVVIGQVTPGPVYTTATLVGYLTNGFLGAPLATAVIFLPDFVFVVATHGVVAGMRRFKTLGHPLDWLNDSSTALMLAVLIVLARDALDRPLAAVLAVAAAVALLAGRLGPTALIGIRGGVGLAAGWIG